MKKSFIAIVFFALSVLYVFDLGVVQAATESVAIIRPDCANKSIATANCYTSLAAWESGEERDLVASDEIAIARIEGSWVSPDTFSVSIDGWTTGPDNYIRIFTAEEARHSGVWDNSKYRIYINAQYARGITIGEDYVRLEGLQIEGDNDSVNAISVSDLSGVGQSYVLIDSNIMKMNDYRARGINLYNTEGAKVFIVNNIVYNSTLYGIESSNWGGTGEYHVYNNTFYKHHIGIRLHNGGNTNTYLYNNIVANCGTDYGTISTNNTASNNISSDSTSPNSSFRNKTVNFVSLTSGNENLLLSSGDTVAKDMGSDLSSNSFYSFSLDINGETRSGDWDIGADEQGAEVIITPNPYCGDEDCNGSETCSTCPSDCGACSSVDSEAPSTPANLQSSSVTYSRATLSWTASTDNVGVSGYNIYRCEGDSCTPVSLLSNSSTHSYTDTGLDANTSYRYRVEAYDSSSNRSGYSSILTVTTEASEGGAYLPTGAHPRLFLTPDRISKLRAIHNSGTHSQWNDMLGYVNQRVEGSYGTNMASQLALLWLVTGDTKYRDAAISDLDALMTYYDNGGSGGPFRNNSSNYWRWTSDRLIYAYDWLYNDLSPAQRQEWANMLCDWATFQKNNGYRSHDAGNNYFGAQFRGGIYVGIATHGETITRATADDPLTILDWARTTKFDYIKNAMANDGEFSHGVYPEGPEYTPQTLSYTYSAMTALKEATGQDLYADPDVANFTRDHIYYTFHQTAPDGKSFPRNDFQQSTNPISVDPVGKGRSKALEMMFLQNEFEGTTEGKYLQYWLNNYGIDFSYNWWRPNDKGMMFSILYNQSAEEINYETDSIKTEFYENNNIGHVLSRYSWNDPDSIYWGFMMGWRQTDHMHSASGHFQIKRKGEWIVGHEVGWAGIYDYSKTHNVMMLENIHPYNRWTNEQQTPSGYTYGGQFSSAGDLDQLNYEATGEYVYVSGEDTNHYNNESYNVDGLDHHFRSFVDLKDGTFLVFDKVKNKQNNWFKRSLIHFPVEATISGNVARVVTAKNKLKATTILPSSPVLSQIYEKDEHEDYHNYYRLTIEGDSAPLTETFLTVLDVGDPSSADKTVSRVTVTSSNMEGTLIDSKKVVLFGSDYDGQSVDTDVSYNVSAGSQLFHLLLDISPGLYDIYKDGSKILSNQTASYEGVLSFDSNGGGTFQITKTGSTPPPPTYACSDNIDNDGDGLIDYPNDPGCSNANDNDETNTVIVDTTAPIISNITSNVGTDSVTISWTTNEASDTQVEYGLSTAYGIATDLDSTQVNNHSVTILGLSSNTTYNFRVKSKDSSGNTAISTNQTFTTEQSDTIDVTPPSAISDLSTMFVNHTSITLSWTAPGDDGNTGVPASYDIRYSTSNITDANWSSASPVSGEPIPNIAGSEEYYTVVNLSPDTTYHFAIRTRDEVSNISSISNIAMNKTHSLDVPICSSFTYSNWSGCSANTQTRTVLNSLPTGCSGGNPIITQSCSNSGSGGSGGGGGSSRSSGAGGNYNDHSAPSVPKNFKLLPADKQITLTWDNPLESDFVRVKVLRTIKENNNSPCPNSHDDSNAKLIYEGTGEEYTDTDLNNDSNYCYTIFAYDKKPNYSQIMSLTSKPTSGKSSIDVKTKTANTTPEIVDNNNSIVELYKNIRLRVKEQNMYQRLKGKILLKVEDDGRAFYIHPQKEEGFYLGRPRDAFRVMREQGVGITTSDLSKIPMGYKTLSGDDSDGDGLPDTLEEAIGTDVNNQDTDGDGHKDKDEILSGYNPKGEGKQIIDDSFTAKHQGKIFLQVESKGEAWYIYNNSRYYLGRPHDAFNLMRELSLGISNTDFSSFGDEEEE